MPKKFLPQKPEIVPSEPEVTVKSIIYKKIAIIIVAVFLAFAAIFLILNREYQWLSKETDKKLSQLNENQVDAVQLEKDYRQNFIQIMRDYLANFAAGANLTKSDLLDKTNQAQEKIMALIVPAKLKDVHLAAVLLLSGLEDSLNKNNEQMIESKLKNLKDLLAKF
ncbi:MAG: hypothetical protein WC610_02920 [Patescibacteria group bacterium]